MANKRQLLGNGNGDIGMFSNLPKEIIHHILKRLLIRDLVRFGCVSKPCKELALSTPTVNLCRFDDTDEMQCETRLQLVNALDRFLLNRGDNKMRKFYLDWVGHCEDEMDEECFCVNESFRMVTWIKNAVRCNVEKLHVIMTFYERESLEFPACVFSCASLRSLKLEMSFTVVKTPSFLLPSNLETLDLADVDIADEGFFKWVSSLCKLLKKLILARINGINYITVESLSLEYFFYIHYELYETCHIDISGEKLETIDIDCRYSPRGVVLNIIAPNVKCLKLDGKVKNNRNLGDLNCLQEASILLVPKEDESDKVYEVLSSLCSVEDLILNEATIKAAYREERMPAQLHNLGCLRIDIGSFSDDLVPAIASLLRGTPNLCSFYMCYQPTSFDPKSDTFGVDMKYWKRQNLDFVSQIEVVTLELSAGSNGIEFAKYVLKHGKSLVKMFIRYLTHGSSIKRKLKNSRTSSNAVVTFKQYKRSVDPCRH